MSNNNITCAYITNEHPEYLKMISNSARMLRAYNTDIPVRCFLILDETKQTIPRAGVMAQLGRSQSRIDLFRKECDENNVELIDCEPKNFPGEEGFFHVNRIYLDQLPEERILYIDADTFIFGNVASLFDHYQEFDLTACEANWVHKKGWNKNFLGGFQPFSSGVMLWNRYAIKGWTSRIPEYFKTLRTSDTDLSQWLYTQHENCLLREEFSVSLHAYNEKLNVGHFQRQHVRLIETMDDLDCMSETIIFHCYTPNWKIAAKKLINKTQRKIPLLAAGLVKKTCPDKDRLS